MPRDSIQSRTDCVHRLLVAVTVHQDSLRSTGSPKREPPGPRIGGGELLEGHDPVGDKLRIVSAHELRVGVADHGHAARLEPDDRNASPDDRCENPDVVFGRRSRVVLRPFGQHRPPAAPAAVGKADDMARRFENPDCRLTDLPLEPGHERVVKQNDGRIAAVRLRPAGEPSVERLRCEPRQLRASVDAEDGFEDATHGLPPARPVHQRSEAAGEPRDVVDAGEQLRPPRTRSSPSGLANLSFQTFDGAFEDPDAGRADMGALPASDAVLDPARCERRGRTIGSISRVEGESRELHHRRRPHEPLAVRGAGLDAQHAFDAVHGVRRRGELGTDNRFGKAAVRPLSLHPGLERLNVREVPRSVDDQIPHDRKARERPDDHLALDRFPAPERLAPVDHHPAHAALLDAAESLVGEALAELLDHVVEGFQHAHFLRVGDFAGLETRRGIAARIVLLDRQGDGIADLQIRHACSTSWDRRRSPALAAVERPSTIHPSLARGPAARRGPGRPNSSRNGTSRAMSWLMGTQRFVMGLEHPFPDRFGVPGASREAQVHREQEMRATGMYEE